MSSSKVFWDALRKHEAQAADAHDERAVFTPGPSANPYYSAYAWWWYDEKNSTHGPYESQRAALRELLEWINHDPRKSLFQRFIDWIAPLDDEGKYG